MADKDTTPIFPTAFTYHGRKEKALYVWRKYQSILKGSVLDVGADQGYLRSHLPPETHYATVGLEPHHDVQVNLEEPLPIEDHSYDCVLCLDVLEHIDNLHALFDRLCTITRTYLVISLPNAWRDFMGMLRFGLYRPERPMKFYSLPVDPPKDRHRWFFSPTEAQRFLEERGERNGMELIQFDCLEPRRINRLISRYLLALFVHRSVPVEDLFRGTIWAVLRKKLPPDQT
jgi:hypothetical protein